MEQGTQPLGSSMAKDGPVEEPPSKDGLFVDDRSIFDTSVFPQVCFQQHVFNSPQELSSNQETDFRMTTTFSENPVHNKSGICQQSVFASGEEDVAKHVQELIREVYAQHNPCKLSDVDLLYGKWAGQEYDLYKRICAKYGAAPQPLSAILATVQAQVQQGASVIDDGTQNSVHDSCEEDVAKQIWELIKEVYAHIGPWKLNDVAVTFSKYAGREYELYEKICAKYGAVPKPLSAG